jgi:hypothetical protein
LTGSGGGLHAHRSQATLVLPAAPRPSLPLIDSNRWFWGILATVTLWKCLVGASLGLIFDECYYWVWALHPQACYFDHPPLVAWSIMAGRALLGHQELAVRLGAILSGIVLALAGRHLAKEMFGAAAGNRAGVFLILAPVFAGNAFLMTPDTWLAPAWALSMLCAWRGLRNGSFAWWAASGAAAGVGLLSKYTMILFFGGLGLIWITSPGKRGRVFLGSLAAGIVALIFFIPVIRWNASNHWASFAHQIHHGFRNEQDVWIHVDFLANYALFLVILVSPGLGLLCFRSAANFADERFRFLAAFFWAVVAFFAYSALKAHIEANWPMMAFVSGLVMVAGDWNRYGKRWKRAALAILAVADGVAVIALTMLILGGSALTPWLSTPPSPGWFARWTGSEYLAREAVRNIADLQAKISEILGPREVAARVAEEFRTSGADFLFADTYQTFGVLAYHQPELEPFLWLPTQGRKRFPWIDDGIWQGQAGLTAEWPRSGSDFSPLFRDRGVTYRVALPGVARPVSFTLNKGYQPCLIRED